MIDTIAIILMLSIAIPITVFYSIRLGRWAWRLSDDQYNERKSTSPLTTKDEENQEWL